MLDAALDAGITFFDTADIYGSAQSERFVGEALAGRSDGLVVATKFGMDMEGTNGDAPRGSREYVRRAIDASLARLGRDHVDLYYYHRPDGVTPLEQTLGAMHELVVEGKVRWLGLSNVDHPPGGGRRVRGRRQQPDRGGAELLQPDPARRRGRRPSARARAGIGYIPYFPLESGLLTGKYRAGEPEPDGARLSGLNDGRLSDERLARAEELEVFAASRGHTLLELAIGGLASIDGIPSVIAGATKPDQVRANVAAGGWQLTRPSSTSSPHSEEQCLHG